MAGPQRLVPLPAAAAEATAGRAAAAARGRRRQQRRGSSARGRGCAATASTSRSTCTRCAGQRLADRAAGARRAGLAARRPSTCASASPGCSSGGRWTRAAPTATTPAARRRRRTASSRPRRPANGTSTSTRRASGRCGARACSARATARSFHGGPTLRPPPAARSAVAGVRVHARVRLRLARERRRRRARDDAVPALVRVRHLRRRRRPGNLGRALPLAVGRARPPPSAPAAPRLDLPGREPARAATSWTFRVDRVRG